MVTKRLVFTEIFLGTAITHRLRGRSVEGVGAGLEGWRGEVPLGMTEQKLTFTV